MVLRMMHPFINIFDIDCVHKLSITEFDFLILLLKSVCPLLGEMYFGIQIKLCEQYIYMICIHHSSYFYCDNILIV